MVPDKYPLYVAAGLTLTAYGGAFALTSGFLEAAAIAAFPGTWLAAHGLLGGIDAATDNRHDGTASRSTELPPDGGDGTAPDSDDNEEDGGPDDDAALRSPPLFRAPY